MSSPNSQIIMFSKWLILQPLGAAKSKALLPNPLQEAEYLALSQTTQQAIYLRKLLQYITVADLGYKADLPVPTVWYEDNQVATEISRNPKFHNRTKHIDVTFHFTCERIASNEIKVVYCPSSDMLADIMSKGLTKSTFKKHRNSLNIYAC